MDDKLRRKFLREAEARQKAERPARPPKRAAEPGAERLYCVRCYAMMSGSICPRCERGDRNVIAYCRKCLRVHPSLDACQAWAPGRCPHCKTVHEDPLADCVCRQCGKVHRTADGRFRIGRCEE